jgi:outer membrane receptor protein involved in Fe transport
MSDLLKRNLRPAKSIAWYPILVTVFLAVLCVIGAAIPGRAQVLYGSLVGNVTDATGASVPGAAIKITHIQTNETREVRTNDSGIYTLSTVPAGTYQVAISREGFRSFTAQDIEVRLNTVVRVDAQLEVGAQAEKVEVTAEAAALQTDRADVHSEFTSQAFVNLPQPTRIYQGLLGLMPGVSPPIAATGNIIGNPAKSMQFSADGTGRSGANVRIDGVSATGLWVQYWTSTVPSQEAIETVNVVTNSPDAEQGLANGAAVNVQLKSGSNQMHGSAYEYNIDSAFKSRPFFLPANQGIPKLIENDYGATLGGHIVRNKLFYFGSYESDPLRQGNATLATVPTAAIRGGDMSGTSNPMYDPNTGNPDGTGRTPFPLNQVPSSRFNSITQKLVAMVPQPNLAGLTSNYYVNTPISYDLRKIATKLDWNATSKLRITGRIGDDAFNELQATIFGDVLSGPNYHVQKGSIFSTSISATYVLSPTVVLDGTWGLTWEHQLMLPPQSDVRYGSDVLGIPGTNLGQLPYAGGVPEFSPSSYTYYGYQYPAIEYKDLSSQYTANATKVQGSHNLRFGLDLSRQHMNHVEVKPTTFAFTGGLTALNGGPSPNQFNSYADFLLGLPQNYSNAVQTVPWATLRTWQYSLYVRDQWQVSRKVTLNYGLRWEYYPVPTRVDRGIERYNFATNQYLICGKGSTPTDCGITVSKRLFSPRIGLAYRPTENFVVRAGYSLAPEQINMARDSLNTSYPMIATFSKTGANSYTAAGTLSAGIPTLAVPDISSGVVPLPAGASFTTDPQNFIRGYVQSWNFTLQKTIARGWIAQAGYVGTHTIHQHTRYNVNYGLPGGGAASQPFFPMGITGAITVVEPLETMHYNSLQTSLQRRFANGFSIQAAYTRSKWIGLCCDDSGDSQPSIPIPQYFNLNRALMPADRPNNFNISSMYELPFGKGKPLLSQNKLASALAGGWRLNGILSRFSGTPFSVSAATTSLNAPGSAQRADQVKPNVAILGGVSPAPYFDPLAFAPVTTARFGTAGFNSLRGPSVGNLDLSIFRDFKVSERFNVQFRAESFNLTNSPHFSNPGANVSNLQLNTDGSVKNLNGYDQITGVSAPSRNTDERYFRFGLRIAF